MSFAKLLAISASQLKGIKAEVLVAGGEEAKGDTGGGGAAAASAAAVDAPESSSCDKIKKRLTDYWANETRAVATRESSQGFLGKDSFRIILSTLNWDKTRDAASFTSKVDGSCTKHTHTKRAEHKQSST